MAQLTRDQLRRFGLTPDTSLGQHFLIDDNVLGVIERLAQLDAADVCWEPGVGVGILTNRLAGVCSHVHGGEYDRRLEPAIDAMRADLPNVTIHWGDALDVDVAAMDPTPTALVSNLPYHVAAPIIAETLQHVPSIRKGCVMVQLEVGERCFAPHGSKGYNALSVLVQGVCRRTGQHKVSRSVFLPPPRVDSVLIAFERHDELIAPADVPEWAAFVKRAFGQRRKTLANNFRATGVAERDATVAALEQIGLGPAARPEEVEPAGFVALYRALAGQAAT